MKTVYKNLCDAAMAMLRGKCITEKNRIESSNAMQGFYLGTAHIATDVRSAAVSLVGDTFVWRRHDMYTLWVEMCL